MRILLTSNASHVPPRGGATRSNLLWLEALSRSGHECRVVGGALPDTDRGKREQLRDEGLAGEAGAVRDGVETAVHAGISVYSSADPQRRVQLLGEQIREFDPDWVLVSSEDLGQLLLREALAAAPGRVVYLAHTPQWFPFGPASWNKDARAAGLVAQCTGVVAIGRHMAGYIHSHTGIAPAVIHPPVYGTGPFANLARFDDGLVTMINPCAVKGLPIFLDIARARPHVAFGALPGWGTTAADRAALAALPNIEILPNCRDIEEFLRRTRVLLMPSLWYEGFGLIAMEAMLRGLPVVASDSGGLQEAKEGTGFVIPVQAIDRFEAVFDEHGMPRPVIEPQSLTPWLEALDQLLTDRDAYQRESAVAREVAGRFVGALDAGEMERYLNGLPHRAAALRILLAQNSPYYPAHGGGDKSNRLLVEALAKRGHTVRVIARTAGFGAGENERYVAELAARNVTPEAVENGVVRFPLHGVDVHVVTAHANLRGYFSEQAAGFAPDVILTSTDDPAQVLLEAALKQERARVVYLARATLALPFGPDCAFPSEQKADALRHADALVGVSEYVANYIRQWGAAEATHVPLSLMDPEPCEALGRFDNEFVTLVNPCAVKGISIFLALAERMPQLQFAAVPTWGTNEGDRAQLEGRANVHVLAPVDRIDDLLKRTRVLIVPSLWAEARSRIIVEAMLRGVPVLAADVGGIPEAMCGVDYLLPVRPIEKYRPRLDEQMVPVAEVPEQDAGPWQAALERLTTDRAHYEALSHESRRAALAYVAKLNVEPFESLLRRVVRTPRKGPVEAAQAERKQSPIESLSPEKRRLLALRLRKKAEGASSGAWFSAAALGRPAALRLFCFPHAGGGMSGFHGWSEALGAAIAVCPVRLPGRESRAAETPFRRMEELIAAIAAAMEPHTGRPFAFFGHSMGAAIAFELARLLRRQGRPQPAALFVSGARAPQYRLGHVPPREPSAEEFLEELHRLEGMPPEVLENRELMRLILPALSADAALYRGYVYSEEPPLACPIRAYGGLKDPNIAREHLDAWKRQTSSSFGMKLFPGGHFFLATAQEAFLKSLAADAAEVCR
jgi:surfactin synthase thioesterase subunit/glycosyltransferase involved in cell wall biosynthesis